MRIRGGAGTADGFPVDGDDPTIVDGGRAGPHPGAEDTVEQVGIDEGQSAPQCCFRRPSVQVDTEVGDGCVGRVIDPLRNSHERLRPCEHRGEGDGEQGGQSVADATGVQVFSHPGEQVEQARRGELGCGFDRAGPGQGR